MKRPLPILLLALLPLSAHPLTKVEADSLVARGQRSYMAGDHQAALSVFDSVAMTHNSAALQLNIGNCWFKLGDVARAVLHYERGLRLAPGDADLRANLDLANEQVKDRITGRPAFALGTTWARLRGGHDPDQWARRSLWACAVFFTLLAMAFIARAKLLRRVAWALSATALVFLALCIAFAGARHGEVTNDREAIIMTPKVDVLGEPRTGSKVLFVLHRGTKVEVLQATEGWCEVQLANGNVGWMPATTIERI